MEQEKQELSSDLKELEINKIYNMDCIECMKLIPDKSVDLIIADPPHIIKLMVNLILFSKMKKIKA